ncbi:MAG TPA: hypothetical protein VMF31_10710 [Solirubrobacterales bacterium]|nr:hypothetical protein [Solirubrobacterales bacterium]
MSRAFKYTAAAIGVFLVVFLGLSALGFGLSWFNTGKDIVSPENVKTQYAAVIEGYESLEATAANACAATGAETDNTLLEDPEFAYAAQYRKVAIDYNRRTANVFEAGKVGPPGYPDRAPALAEMQAKVCP